MPELSFFSIFAELEDPRDPKNRKYPLMDVIVLTIYGLLCGKIYFTRISKFLKAFNRITNNLIITELHISSGIPSHDVFSDVFRGLDKDKFVECFIKWVSEVVYYKTGQHIAIDGKAVRAAALKAKGGKVPYILSAFLCELGISIGQIEINEKNNEITEIPRLLDLLDIEGCPVTIDAIGTQTEIMKKLHDKHAPFCLQLKDNQHNTYVDVSKLFESAFEDAEVCKKLNQKYDALSHVRSFDKDHGRIEIRDYYVFKDEEQIRLAIDPKWEYVKAVGMAVIKRTVIGKEEKENEQRETHFHLLSDPIRVDEYANLARGHWSIENSLHWILDEHFCEDRCTSRADRSIFNVSLMKKIAFNLVQLAPREAEEDGETFWDRKNYLMFHPDLVYSMLSTPVIDLVRAREA